MEKLTTITPTYRSFVPDQVLTADQLNEFLNYFDDQDRLSRIFLSGVGIVCGFNVSYDNGQMIISQGAGIDTDGDLLKLSKPDNDDPTLEKIDISELTFAQYRQFDDNAVYKPFFWKTINGVDVQLNLLEAIPEGQATVTDPYISSLNLQDLVVLLYLEDYAEDPSACTGINCENQGIKNIRKLRVLLVSQADADYILSHDTMFDANYLISTYLSLDEVAVQRVTVNAANSTSFAALRSNYLSAMQAENIIDRLKTGFSTMLGKLGMSAEATLITNQLNQLFGVGAIYPQLYFQYRYDLLRDVVSAYDELKSLFMDSICACNPNIHSFPKHLMLGRLVPTQDDRFLKSYRHDFYKSPILLDEKNWCERFNLYVERVIEMLNTFTATDITPAEIKITPSSFRSLLENKAIPFYYNFGAPLLNAWNFDKYQVNKQNRNLSYHTALLDSSGPIQLPLKYNLEPHNFLAIEGHQGYSYMTAMQRIDALKTQYGLAFDVKALGITVNPNDPINIDDYACHFEDLQVLLDAWTQEHECLLGKVSYFFSSFSTVVPGYNYHENDFVYPVEPAPSDTAVAVKNPGYNAVKANLYNDKNALGGLLVKAYDKFRGCSGRDIIVQIDREIDRLGFERDDTMVEATLKSPNEVLSYAYVLLDKRPVTLFDVRPDVIHTIDVNATNLCAAARRGFMKATALKTNPATQMMLINLNQDITALCCSADKLKLIHEEIERRKQDILLGLSLAKFQEQHPGMEHLAGVHQGDTFLLVYVKDAINGIPGNTVVADFTLPYLCCSDCRPVGFILPPVVADLRLSSDTYCIGTSTGPIELYPYPADGIVAFTPAVPGITINGNQLVIDTTLIPESQIGQPISFTVNGSETNATLTFYKTPQVEIVVPPNPLMSGSVAFALQYDADEFDPNDFTFLWEFGDGETSTEPAPIHRYEIPVNPENQVTVTLTITPIDGAACPFIGEKVLEFVPVTLVLNPTTFCQSDPESYRIATIPKGAIINPSGSGVYSEGPNLFMFSPNLAGPGMIEIRNNGEVKLVVQVNPSPTADIDAIAEGDNLRLFANLQYQTNFYWEFTNEAGEQVHEQVNELDPVLPFSSFSVEDGQIINIALHAWNECTETVSRTSVVKPTPAMECSALAGEYILFLRDEFTTIFEESQGSFSPEAELIISDARQFYEEATSVLSAYLSGSENGSLGVRIKELGTGFFNQILVASEEGDPLPLVKLYHNIMRLGLSFVRCQSEELFINPQIVDMIKKFTDQMNEDLTPSLPSVGITSNTEENLAFLTIVLNLREQGSASWDYVNTLRTMVAWIPA